MKAVQKPTAFLLIQAFVLLASAGAQEHLRAEEAAAFGQALRGPERADFRWQVRVVPPRLTYQQRNLVEVRVTVDGAALRVKPTDLRFLVKVADQDGRWLPGADINDIQVPADVGKKQEIRYVMGMYLRPGTYTVGTVLHDGGTDAWNVTRKEVRVPEVARDPLPGLDRDLPEVEFLREVPRDSDLPPASLVPAWIRRRWPPANGPRGDQTWALGAGRERLPVGNTRPLQVDVVLNFSSGDNRRTPQGAAMLYRQNAGALLQIGSVLSHLGAAGGCVQVHGVDVLRMKKIFEGEAAGADWKKISHTVYGADRTTVDVATLAGQKQASAWFAGYLRALFAANACGAGERVVIVVSRDMEFASGTKLERLGEKDCNCRMFYLEIPGFNLLDELWTMLKGAGARHMKAGNPREFREALAEIISELGPGAR
jgi:hypothetical protein